MAGMKFRKGSEEWQLFMDYWTLCQNLWVVEDNDEYWENVIKETDAFYKKYNSDFAKSLALSLIEELEKRNKKIDSELLSYKKTNFYGNNQ